MQEPAALLTEVVAPNSGVLVHIPKLNASLYMESSPEGTFKVISSPLQGQNGTQRPGFRNIFANLKSYADNSLAAKNSLRVGGETPNVIYRRGESSLYLYYLVDKVTKKVDIPDMALDKVVMVSSTESCLDLLAFGKNSHDNMLTCIVTIAPSSDSASVQFIDATGAQEILQDAGSRVYGGYSGGWERVVPSTSQCVVFGGSLQHIAAIVSTNSTSELRVFEREKELNRGTDIMSSKCVSTSLMLNSLTTLKKKG